MHTHARSLRPGVLAFLVAALLLTVGADAAIPQYGDMIGLTLSFYEAQMSGDVPSWSYARAWRGPSHMMDGQPNYDATGGWYTDGGHIKNSLTIATSASQLAYAGLTWEGSIRDAGEWSSLVQNVDWAASYLQKCASVPGKFIAQVGDHFTEEAYWGPPEDAQFSNIKYSPGWRPVYTINYQSSPDGADVLSQAVATLTGAALLHMRSAASATDPAQHNARAAELLQSADALWPIAKGQSAVWKVPEGNRTINSRTYTDDQAWAAAWMCKREAMASGGAVSGSACVEANSMYKSLDLREGTLNSDDMHAIAISFLLNLGVGDATDEVADLQIRYLDEWRSKVAAASASTNPCQTGQTCKAFSGPCGIEGGFVVGGGAASTQYSSSMAFLALAATSNRDTEGAFGTDVARSYRCAAKSQIDFLLGKNPKNQAFVTGLDDIEGLDASIKFPRNPRHRGSSCNGKGKECASLGQRNPNRLKGALVGGPRMDGSFTDSRISEPDNLVSIEFNSVFMSALSGLMAVEDFLTSQGSNWEDYCT